MPALRRRRPRRWIIALIVVGALVVALICVDGWVRRQAESRIAAQVQSAIGRDEPVGVNVRDMPFLVDLATDKIRRVEISVPDLQITAQGKQFPLKSVRVSLRDLLGLHDASHAVVDELHGDLSVDYAALSSLTGVHLTSDGGTRIVAATTVQMLGAEVAVRIVSGVSLGSDGVITLIGPQAELAGVEVPHAVLQGAIRLVQSKLVLPTLPADLRYDDIGMQPGGVVVHISGRQVELSKLR